MEKMTFIRDFITEANANKFAQANGGKVTVHYDYDELKGKLIKTYRVKY